MALWTNVERRLGRKMRNLRTFKVLYLSMKIHFLTYPLIALIFFFIGTEHVKYQTRIFINAGEESKVGNELATSLLYLNALELKESGDSQTANNILVSLLMGAYLNSLKPENKKIIQSNDALRSFADEYVPLVKKFVESNPSIDCAKEELNDRFHCEITAAVKQAGYAKKYAESMGILVDGI